MYLEVLNLEKKIGGDISSNKKTYLIIKLLEKANPTDKESILKLMNDSKKEENKIKFITDMMLKYQIDKIAKQKMDIYFEVGMNILSDISGKQDNILELKNYFEKIRDRKFQLASTTETKDLLFLPFLNSTTPSDNAKRV